MFWETAWSYIGPVLEHTWWFLIFFPIFRMTHGTWLAWRQRVFEHGLKWEMIEVRIPREILKSARGMDQVFQSIAAMRNSAGDLQEKYWDGEVPRWTTFEMVSFGGEIHFYMRVYKKLRALIEAAFYAFYPDVELIDVPPSEDYATKILPHTIGELNANGLALWGSEMILNKPPLYPLKTYLEFENMEEMHQFDPMSAFLETLSKVKPGEYFMLQYNVQPLPRSWGKDFEHEFDELKKPKRVKVDDIGHGEDDIMSATVQRTPGLTQNLEIIERNLEKPAFETTIRFLYVYPVGQYNDSFARRTVMSTFNQFADAGLNSFRRNEKMSTKTKGWNFPYVFPETRVKLREQRLLEFYRDREMWTETFMGRLLSSHIFNFNTHSKPQILSSESLASLWHPPSNLVLTGPHTTRMESKKMGAPAGLPIYADEKVLDKFK